MLELESISMAMSSSNSIFTGTLIQLYMAQAYEPTAQRYIYYSLPLTGYSTPD